MSHAEPLQRFDNAAKIRGSQMLGVGLTDDKNCNGARTSPTFALIPAIKPGHLAKKAPEAGDDYAFATMHPVPRSSVSLSLARLRNLKISGRDVSTWTPREATRKKACGYHSRAGDHTAFATRQQGRQGYRLPGVSLPLLLQDNQPTVSRFEHTRTPRCSVHLAGRTLEESKRGSTRSTSPDLCLKRPRFMTSKLHLGQPRTRKSGLPLQECRIWDRAFPRVRIHSPCATLVVLRRCNYGSPLIGSEPSRCVPSLVF
jgi:hypothetical protein